VIRVASIEDIQVGDVFWCYARGYWRQVRVLQQKRTTVRVAYLIQTTRSATPSIRVQDLPLHRFRLDRPPGHYGILDVPAPRAEA
jgi:hypothetical protein